MKEFPYMVEDEGGWVSGAKGMPFLGSFDERHMREILNSSRVREYEAEEAIIREGDRDAWLYILIAGRARVVKNNAELAVFGNAGDIFGEMAIVSNRARSASVVAAEKTYCLAIDAAFMENLAPEDRTACYAMFYRLLSQVISERLKTTNLELARLKQELEVLKRKTEQVS